MGQTASGSVKAYRTDSDVNSYPLQEGPWLGGESCHVNYLIRQTKNELWGSNRIQSLPCIFHNVQDTSQITMYIVWRKEIKALQDIVSCQSIHGDIWSMPKGSWNLILYINVCEHIGSTPNGPWYFILSKTIMLRKCPWVQAAHNGYLSLWLIGLIY